MDIRGSDSESESDDNDDDESGPETSPEFLYSDVGDRSVVASGNEKAKHRKEHVCEECGISVKKPALLIQHMRTHSSQVFIPFRPLSESFFSPHSLPSYEILMRSDKRRSTGSHSELRSQARLSQIITGAGDPLGSPGSASRQGF